MPWTGAAPGHGFSPAAAPWHPFSGDPVAHNLAAQITDPGSLLGHYRRWIALRRGSAALRRGDLFLLDSGREPGVVAFLRRVAGERILVVHNLGREAARFAAPAPCDQLARRGGDGEVRLAPLAGEGCLLDLPGRSAWVGEVTPRDR
jgi:alpha-glucosidase